MKLDLNLLSMRFSQAENEPPVPTDGVNEYLLEKILLPCMNGDTIRSEERRGGKECRL